MTTLQSRFRPGENIFLYEPTKNRFFLAALKREKEKHGLDVSVRLLCPVPLGMAQPNLAYEVEGNPLTGYDITLGVNPQDYLRIINEMVAKIKSKISSGGIYAGSFISEKKYYG